MVFGVEILCTRSSVLYRLVILEVWRVGLMCQHIAAVPLVLNDPGNRCRIPYLVTKFGLPAIAGKKVSDLGVRPAVQKQVKDYLHCLCLVLIDHQMPIFILVVSQKRRG